MDANEPEKKMPSTAANATRRSPKTEQSSEIQVSAHSAFFWMQGTARRNMVRRVRREVKAARRTGLDCVEELGALLGLANVGVDEERVDLGVDVLPARAARMNVNSWFRAPPSTRSTRTHIMIWKP
jgi:hypothetical protein